MKNTLQMIFRNYPHLCDEDILNNLLTKVDDEDLKEISTLEELQSFLFQLNKKIEKSDLLSILFKLQANINIMDYALKDYEDDLALSMKTLNSQNIQFMEGVINLLDFIEFEKR